MEGDTATRNASPLRVACWETIVTAFFTKSWRSIFSGLEGHGAPRLGGQAHGADDHADPLAPGRGAPQRPPEALSGAHDAGLLDLAVGALGPQQRPQAAEGQAQAVGVDPRAERHGRPVAEIGGDDRRALSGRIAQLQRARLSLRGRELDIGRRSGRDGLPPPERAGRGRELGGRSGGSGPEVDKIAFTGSTAVGKQIMRSASYSLKRVTLELGGKSPNIILPDADFSKAIPGALNGVMFNQGQVCCAGSRVFIQKKQYDNVVADMASHAKNIKQGAGLDPSTQIGPLVSEEQQKRVLGYIAKGITEGAEVVAGGTTPQEDGYFVSPTIFADVNDSMTIAKEEIFGPVIAALPYEDLDDVIKRANTSEYGLAAGVWTQDLTNAHYIASKLRAGTVWINCYNAFDAASPFGGYKQSGIGREMGSYALSNYTEVKSVWVNLNK